MVFAVDPLFLVLLGLSTKTWSYFSLFSLSENSVACFSSVLGFAREAFLYNRPRRLSPDLPSR